MSQARARTRTKGRPRSLRRLLTHRCRGRTSPGAMACSFCSVPTVLCSLSAHFCPHGVWSLLSCNLTPHACSLSALSLSLWVTYNRFKSITKMPIILKGVQTAVQHYFPTTSDRPFWAMFHSVRRHSDRFETWTVWTTVSPEGPPTMFGRCYVHVP